MGPGVTVDVANAVGRVTRIPRATGGVRAEIRPTVRDGGLGREAAEILPETGNDQDQSGATPGDFGGTRNGPETPGNPAKLSRRGGRRARAAKLGATTVDRAQKEAVVAELGRIFADSGVVVVAHYEGLSVAEMTDFRLRMKQAGGGVRVAKNKLAKIALKGTPGEKMGDLLTGMTVLAYSEDPVAAAKAVEDFTKVNKKLVVLGGAMGATPLDQAGVTAVAADAVARGAHRFHRGDHRRPRRASWSRRSARRQRTSRRSSPLSRSARRLDGNLEGLRGARPCHTGQHTLSDWNLKMADLKKLARRDRGADPARGRPS